MPRLVAVSVPTRPAAAALVLHGGASRRDSVRVSPTQLSVLRMIPIARRLAWRGRGRLAVFRLLNSTRGWDGEHTPVHDAQWALAQIVDRLGSELPVGLVGHSLGGRAALLTAGHASVRSVVALAPWVYPSDVASDIEDRPILFVHGTEDRIARLDRAVALARAVAQRGARVSFVRVRGGRHAMLRRRALFDGLAADFATATLLGTRPERVVARLDAGEHWLEL